MAYNQSAMTALTNYLIDGTEISTILIQTTNEDKIFAPQFVSVELQNLSGFVSVPTLQVGINEADYNNWLSSTVLTSMTTERQQNIYQIPNLALTAFGGTNIYVNITLGAVATSYLLRVSVQGFYY